MSIFLQKKYASLLPLKGYQVKHNGKHFSNFRCSICNDSRKKESLKRGWFIESDNQLVYHCYNCGYHKSFSYFLKERFPDYYKDYIRELFEDKRDYQIPKKTDIFKDEEVFVNLTKIKELPKDHRVNKYCKNRSIPLDMIQEYYYSDNFYDWCHKKQPDNFKIELDSDPRIIFPFLDKQGTCFGLSGRTIDFSEAKYLTIKFDEDKPKVFGLDRLNIHKTVYICEGQIDSLYVDNCLGAIGALGSVDEIVKYCNLHDKSKTVIIPDNEKRNKHTCNFIEKNINKGYSIVLWPETKFKFKDLNDLAKLGLTREDIFDMITKNTYSGLNAKLKLSSWRKS